MMILHFITMYILLLLGLTVAEKSQQCSEIEEFKSCGTACSPTCQNKNPQICTLNCVSGCFCKKGYIREGPGGRCVASCENVPICNENEQFSTCATACPRICNETKPKICPLICKTGCICNDGYVREKTNNGKCIPEAGCQKICGQNEVYNECGTACPGTCAQPVKACVKKCVKGCFCKDDYILDKTNGTCIIKNECPKYS